MPPTRVQFFALLRIFDIFRVFFSSFYQFVRNKASVTLYVPHAFDQEPIFEDRKSLVIFAELYYGQKGF